MKKTSYIVLLIILLMQSGGLLLIYKIQQWKVQYEMFQALIENQSGLLKLTLPLSEYQGSMIKAHEISWKGKMYDVKSAVVTGNSVTLLVMRDTREENILRKIKLSADNTASQNRDLPHQLVKLLTLTYLCPVFENIMMIQELQENNFPLLREDIDSIASDIPSPPPESV